MTEKNRVSWILCALSLLVSLIAAIPSQAETVMDKIERAGQVTVVGLREDAPPFAFYDKSSNRVGFSVDVAQRLSDELSKKLNKTIQVSKKPVNSKPRIPLAANGEISRGSLAKARRTPILPMPASFMDRKKAPNPDTRCSSFSRVS